MHSRPRNPKPARPMKIAEVYTEFSKRLSQFGHVVIAGGAARDSLLGREPKDYDVFVLYKDEFKFDEAKEKIAAVLSDLDKVKPVVDWHRSEPYLVADVKWGGCEVQVLVNPARSVAGLIATFDWNVCLFAYDGTFHSAETIDSIGPGKSLRLQKVTFAASTLRRGYRFSERFKMKLEREDVLRLCREVVAKADAKNSVGPTGAEPDAKALSANVLVEDRS